MTCGPCSGNAPGYTTVWQYRLVGNPVVEFGTQHDALLEREKNGGRGTVLKTTKKAATASH